MDSSTPRDIPLTADPNFIPYNSPEYERDEYGNIKIYNPDPNPQAIWQMSGGYSPPEPSIVELREIKDLLKQILNKLR